MSQTPLTFWPDDVLHSLCVWIVAQAAARSPAVTLNYANVAAKRHLWRNSALDTQSVDPATILKIYNGGPLQFGNRLPVMNVQVQTAGSVDDEVSRQIQTVFECLLDAAGLPLRAVLIPAFLAADGSSAGFNYLLVYVDPLQRPGQISRETNRGRVTFGFNFEMGFKKAS